MASQPKTVRSGDPITARTLNVGVVQALQKATVVGSGSGLEKRQIGKGISVSNKEESRSPTFAVASKKVKITAIKEDYLECTIYNERSETDGDTVMNVAKQRRFRPSLYDGVTISFPNGDEISYTKDVTNPEWKRQADNQTATVDQIPVPMWYVGEVIRCSQSSTSAVTDVDSFTINWEEDEPREWAVI